MAGIEDVARLAGVSTATVSRALSGKDHVSAKSKAKVEAAAAELGYVAPAAGGQAKRVTKGEPSVMHFLHGVSPDGHRLAYVRMTMRGEMLFDNGHIHLLDLTSGKDVSLTTATEPEDGSEFSADGNWVYLNTCLLYTSPSPRD